MSAKPSKNRRKTILAIVVTVILCAFIGLITLMFGRVTGTEFSPTHFTSRSFVLYEIPILHLQVTPITRTSEVVPITNLLVSQNYIQVPKGESDTWHLVEISRGLSTTTPGDSEILFSHMKLAEGSSSPIWETWTRDNPAAAAVLWPKIKTLAERELYILVPELFTIASKETDPQLLSDKIDAYLRNEYHRLAEDLLAAKQPELAASVVADGLKDYPKDQPLLELQKDLTNRS